MASRRIGQPKHRNEALRLSLLGESTDFLGAADTGVLAPFVSYSPSLSLLWKAEDESATSTTVNAVDGVAFSATGGAGRTYWVSGALVTTTGNELRHETDPVTGLQQIVAEAAFTQAVTNSENISSVNWVKIRCSTSSITSVVAPDETTNSVYRLVESADTGTHYTRAQNMGTAKSAAVEVWSGFVMVKAAERTRAKFRMASSVATVNYAEIDLDLSTGLASNIQAAGAFSGAYGRAVSVAGGWFVMELSCTTDNETTIQPALHILDNAGNISYAGDGSSGIYFWGSNLTKTPSPMSYFKTSGAADGPNADVPKATGWAGASNAAGTFYLDATFPESVAASEVWANFNDGSAANEVRMYKTGGDSAVQTVATGNDFAESGEVLLTGGGRFRYVFGAAVNDGRYYINGTASAADSTLAVPQNLSEVEIGAQEDGSNPAYRVLLHELRYYNQRAVDTGATLSLDNLSQGLVNEGS